MDGMREGWGLEEKEGFKEILNKVGFLTSIGFLGQRKIPHHVTVWHRVHGKEPGPR